MNIVDILERSQEIVTTEDSNRNVTIKVGDLANVLEYITLLEVQTEQIAKERNSYFTQLNNELIKKEKNINFYA